MKQLAHLPELEKCSKVFLDNIERPRGLFLCWQEPTRLGCVKIDTTTIGTPQYLKFTAVCEVKALSKYLFAASNNSLFFWTPDNSQTPPSVFIELAKGARIVSFAFHNGRFLLVWTVALQRKVFVTLTSKKAQILAQREISALAIYDLSFLGLPDPPFLIKTVPGRVWVTLPDASLWTASLEDDSIGEFDRVANLHSPAVCITQRADCVDIVCCLGRFCSISSSLDFRETKCVAPVLRVLHSENLLLAVTPSESFILERQSDGFLEVNRAECHGVLCAASGRNGSEDLICVLQSGRIFSCASRELFSIASPESNSNNDPWEKLRKLADLRESRALAQVSVMDSVQRQMALLMYLKFNALAVDCDVTQQYYPSMIEDHVVTCELKTAEPFDPSMWVVSVVLKPYERNVLMMTSAPFNHKGTSISLQFGYPRSILLNMQIFLSLRTCSLPRTLSLMIREQDLCARSSFCAIASPAFLVHRPSLECCVAKDLDSLLRSIVGDSGAFSASAVEGTQLSRIVSQKADRKQMMSLRAIFIKILMEKCFHLQPKFLVPKSMAQVVEVSKEQLHACVSMKDIVTCYKQWRSYTLKLPIL